LTNTNKPYLQIGNIVGFIATIIVNFLANLIPIGVGNTGELSDSLPNLFVPAGLTFSIWGVIYALLALFSIYQARDIFRKDKLELAFLDRIGYLFIVSSVANIAWIFFWHYQLVPLSLVAMIVIFITLVLIYIRLDIGRSEVPRYEKLLVHVPFSVYLGWITVATIANVTAVLVDAGIPSYGFLAEFFTIFVISVAVIITLLMLYIRKDIAYSLVIAWATLGIFIKQITLNLTIGITGLIAVIVVLIGAVITGIRIYKKD
jgi:hypothetical protein